MEDTYITFETAKLSKEKEFNEICDSHFEEDGGAYDSYGLTFKPNDKQEHEILYARPTQSLLQRWLREVHKINVESNYLPNIQKYSCLYIPMTGKASIKDINYVSKIRFNTYEEALEKGLQEALKLI